MREYENFSSIFVFHKLSIVIFVVAILCERIETFKVKKASICTFLLQLKSQSKSTIIRGCVVWQILENTQNVEIELLK